jgi:hypothetical protein
MGKTKLTNIGHGLYEIFCEGCKESHHINTVGEHPVWEFNGNLDKPTFKPSVRVTTQYSAEENPNPTMCHFVITDGKIAFCDDCTHELKSQTLELKEIE